MENESLLIGLRVSYSVQKQEKSTGVIVDKINMKDKITDTFTVTGYLIEDDNTKLLKPFSYWRIEKVIDEDEESPKGHLEGGYTRKN